jgi:hypothetical protein
MMNTIKILTEIRRLKKQNTKLAVRNIVLWSNLRTIAEDPSSNQAKQIIAKYKKQNEIEKEIDQAKQN